MPEWGLRTDGIPPEESVSEPCEQENPLENGRFENSPRILWHNHVGIRGFSIH